MTTDARTLSWDWREQPDLDELARIVHDVSGGTIRLQQIDTGSDGYEIAFTAATSGERAWLVAKVPHDETVPVSPWIWHHGRLIGRSAGDSDVEHTRTYAAQLLAAADELERRAAGASPAARGTCASGPWLGHQKRAVCDLRPLEGRFGGSDPQARP